jgi:cellobiose transport system permease protein
MEFVGLAQYRFLVSDPNFWQAVGNTLIIWVLATVPMLFLSLVMATMLHSTMRLTSFYRVAFFVPNVTSLVAAAIFFGAAFATQFGLVNVILRSVGFEGLGWLTNPWLIKVVIAFLMTWQWAGYNAIIYLAGLQAIPDELYEAAKVDGAGPVQSFFRITIPMLRPIILFTVVVSTVTGLQSFTEPQVLFGSSASVNPNSGGPGQAGLTMVLYFFHQAFDNRDYGYGAAIAWAVFMVVVVFTLLNWRIVARKAD